MLFESPAVCWMLLAAEAVGLVSAWIARLSTGSRLQTFCYSVYLVCLGAVVAGAPLSLGLGTGFWLASSVTVALMILMVTCDFRSSRHQAVW